MNRKNDYSGIIAFFLTIAVLLVIGLIMDASEPKCIKSGCDREQSSGSSYCYLHKPSSINSSYKSNSSSYSSSGSGSSSYSSGSGSSSYNSGSSSSSKTSSGKTSSTSSSTKSKKTYSSNPYESYDEGYEDVYEDEDYDWDRYYSDPDYADGVDDAMDELDW